MYIYSTAGCVARVNEGVAEVGGERRRGIVAIVDIESDQCKSE